VVARLQEQHGIALDCSPALAAHIIDRCDVRETGARRLIAFIEQNLLPALARQWLGALQDKRRILRIHVDVATPAPEERVAAPGDSIICRTEFG
jgi:type VI secretion system protein VasG